MSIITVKTASDASLYQASIAAIECKLESRRIYTPPFLYELLTSSDTSNQDLKLFKTTIGYERLIESERKGLSATFRQELLLTALEAAHDQWRRESVAKFYEHNNESQYYRFLPFYFLGFETAMEYLPYVEPVLIALELNPVGGTMVSFYQDNQRMFFGANSVNTSASLRRLISLANLDLDPSIALTLHNNPKIASLIAAQVVDRNRELFAP